MKPTILGIAGPKRAGKDTAAKLLIKAIADMEMDVLVGVTSFADPMYDMLSAFLDPDTVARLRNSDEKDTLVIEPFGCTLRHLAQTLGTEWGRNLIHPNAWVMAMQRRISMAVGRADPGTPKVILIPDVRFPNEAEFVRDNGFLLHIQRDTGHSDSHSSETPLEVEDTDTVLQNTGSLEQFEQKVLAYGHNDLTEDLTAAFRASAGVGRLLSDAPPRPEPV